jgi:hypothetical protein
VSAGDLPEVLAMTLADKELVTKIVARELIAEHQVARVVAMREAFADGNESLAVLYARNLCDDMTRLLNDHARTMARLRAANYLLDD